MLLNAIPYPDGSNLQISVCALTEYPVHYHHDLEIVYLLKGSAILKNGCSTCTLSQGDIYTIPPGSVHGIRGMKDDNIVAVVHVRGDYLESHFPDAVPHVYHTLLENKDDPDLGWLKELILQLIAAYFHREDGYQDTCNALLHRIITLINQRFLFFGIGSEQTQDFHRVDERVADRMIHIFKYLVDNLRLSPSLTDLAEKENLSTFYLSHLIKEHTGCSFRELVSYMRVQYSEIALLEGQGKTSRIARSCGFSTSRYYEEAFRRWYHTTPDQHFASYRHMRLDVSNLPSMDFLDVDDVLSLVAQLTFHVISQNRLLTASSSEPINLHYGPDSQTIKKMNYPIAVSITLDALRNLRTTAWQILDHLQCQQVILLQRTEAEAEEISKYVNLFREQGIEAIIAKEGFVPQYHRYGNDTIAGMIRVILDAFYNGDEVRTFPLQDQLLDCELINGGEGLYTPSGVHKPFSGALYAINSLPGELKLRGKNYGLIAQDRDYESLLLLAFNYNDEILQLCHKAGTPQAAEEVIRSYRDELDLRFHLELPAGNYSIGRFTYTHHSSFFHLLSEQAFRGQRMFRWEATSKRLFSPYSEGRLVKVEDSLDVDVTLRGLALQLILIRRED